jgi:hypothetical protein
MPQAAVKRVAFLSVILLSAFPLSAQDMAEMQKWAGAKLIHYHLVGEYSGPVTMIPSAEREIKVNVSDRIEIDFDWNNMQAVGQPVVKNFPSKNAPPEAIPGCPAVKVNGTLEYFTLQSVDVSPMMILHGKRDLPAGSVPKADVNEVKPCAFYGWDDVAASAPAVEMKVQLPQPMMLAMPAAPGFEMEFSKDHKSFIQKINTDGWVWTMTPTIVR